MDNKPSSPFANLDTALVRSTKRDSAAPAPRPQPQEQLPETTQSGPLPPPPHKPAKEQIAPEPVIVYEAHRRARMHARMHTPLEDELEKVIAHKRHLSSYTFRFSAEELDDLEAMKDNLNTDRQQEVSKNDVIRLAVHLLRKQLDPKR